MKLKSISIAVNNTGILLKSVLVQCLFMAIFVGIGMIYIPPLVDTIMTIINQFELAELISFLRTEIANPDSNAEELAVIITDIIKDIQVAVTELPDLINGIESSFLVVLALLCMYRVMISAPDIAVAFTINEFMSTNARRPFVWYFFKRIALSLRFALVQFLIVLPLDMIVIFSIVGFSLLTLTIFSWVSVVPTIIIALVLYSLRQSMLAFWLPSIVVERMSVRLALRNNFAVLSKRFGIVFLKNFACLTFVAIVAILSNYFYFSIGLAVTATVISLIGFYLIKCINLVEYYSAMQMPFFSKNLHIQRSVREKAI